eukprot:PhM_4_TR14086/c5_g1_i4/m.107049
MPSMKKIVNFQNELKATLMNLMTSNKLNIKTVKNLNNKITLATDNRTLNAIKNKINKLSVSGASSIKEMNNKKHEELIKDSEETMKYAEGEEKISKKALLRRVFKIPKKHEKDSIIEISDYLKDITQRYMKKVLKEKSEHKTQHVLIGEYHNLISGVEDVKRLNVHSIKQIRTIDDIEKLIKNLNEDIEKAIEIAKFVGSGWTFIKWHSYEINTFNIEKLRGKKYIELPKDISNPKCGLVNIKNDDDECFKWCMLYHQSKQLKNGERLTVLKKVEDKYDWTNIKFPVGKTEIDIFEKNNNVSINVMRLIEDDEGKPKIEWFKKSECKSDKNVILLYYEKDEQAHYIYVKSVSKLLKASTMNKHIVCNNCLKSFTEKQHNKHNCTTDEFKTKIEYPDKDARMTFTNYKKQLAQPFICYADFEAFVKDNKDENKINKHVVNSYCYKIICTFDDSLTRDIKIYRDVNPVDHFIKSLLQESDINQEIINKLRKQYEKPNLTITEENDFKNADDCSICNKKLNNDRVRDHCHLTGKYRGATHNKCNLEYNQKYEMPVVFHNLRGYDGHFIIKSASYYTSNIRVIAQTFEKYMSFSFMKLRFIDSFLFMSDSLDKLSTNLKLEDMKYSTAYWTENIDILRKKGVYPYEYIKDFDIFETTELPEINKFYSQLSLKGISDNEYEHAQNVWRQLKCNTFGDYHDIYLKTDVLLLTDVFEKFRLMTKQIYKLEATNYNGAPGLSWEAMLKMSDEMKFTGLGPVHDDKMRNFFEESKRGGIVMAFGQRKAIANNKYMKSYNEQEKSNFISYLDMNNLYGKAMCDILPEYVVGYVDKSINEIIETEDDAEYGYFVKCNITIPEHIKEKTKGYPLFPESRAVEESWLSDYQKSILKQNDKKFNKTSKKLLLTLYDKENYICHYRYIKFALSIGFTQDCFNVKEVIKFKQSKWLKNYIDMNTALRTKAGNDFEKDYFKLMNNIIYGKTNENILNRTDLRIVTEEDKAIKAFTKDNFKTADYCDGMYYILGEKEECKYDRPIYVGCAILDLSKIYMAEFYYNYMQPKYNDKMELIYTDTDSFVFNIETDDLFKDMWENKHLFDLSDSKQSNYQ